MVVRSSLYNQLLSMSQHNQSHNQHAASYAPYTQKPLTSRLTVAVTTVLQHYHMSGVSWRYNKMLQEGLAELLSEINEVGQNFQELITQIGALNQSMPSLFDTGMDASAVSLHLYLSPSGQDLLTTNIQPMDTSLDFSTSSLPTTSSPPTMTTFPNANIPLSSAKLQDVTMGDVAAELHISKAAEKLLNLVALLIGTPSVKRYNRFHTDVSELIELIPMLYSMFKGGRSLGVIYDYARWGWTLGAMTTVIGLPSPALQLVMDALRNLILNHNALIRSELDLPTHEQHTRLMEPC